MYIIKEFLFYLLRINTEADIINLEVDRKNYWLENKKLGWELFNFLFVLYFLNLVYK